MPLHQSLINDVVLGPNNTVCACTMVVNGCAWNLVVMVCHVHTAVQCCVLAGLCLSACPACCNAEYTYVFAEPTQRSKACEVIESTPPKCVKHLEQQALSALLYQACQTHCTLCVSAVVGLESWYIPTQLCCDPASDHERDEIMSKNVSSNDRCKDDNSEQAHT